MKKLTSNMTREEVIRIFGYKVAYTIFDPASREEWKTWEQIHIDKCFDDHNNGHRYSLSKRLIAFSWYWPRMQGRYGRKNP